MNYTGGRIMGGKEKEQDSGCDLWVMDIIT